MIPLPSLANAWDILLLFIIPIGGGIPSGVLLARNRSIAWPVTAVLYLISDLILACVFEPILLATLAAGKKSPRLGRMGEAFKKAIQKTTHRPEKSGGVFSLILIAFGVDPMTGRAATLAAGHGFVTGWALSILGDMLYFAILMASTLWLDGILGDGTRTTLIILAGMTLIPWAIRKAREKRRRQNINPPRV